MGNFGSNKHREEPNLTEWNLKEKMEDCTVWSLISDPSVEI